jgi:hypothetical protein
MSKTQSTMVALGSVAPAFGDDEADSFDVVPDVVAGGVLG